jgi:hypothetical protein
MASDRGIKAMLSEMTTKQKVMIVALVLLLIIVIWQVMGLFDSSTPPATPAITPVQGSAPNTGQPPAAMATGAPGAPGAAPAGFQQPAPMEQQPALREAPVVMSDQILDLQKKTEQKYLEQVNQLQMLKLQREIAETNQAIASAKLATVTAEKNVSDLLTKPVPASVPVVPAGAYSGTLVTPAQTGVTVVGPGPGNEPPIMAPPSNIPYVVISVSMQFGRWSAVMGYQGKLYNVVVGDVLPVDGSVVAGINKNGVYLVKDGKRRKVSIISSV